MRHFFAAVVATSISVSASAASSGDGAPGLTAANRNVPCEGSSIKDFMSCPSGSVWAGSFHGSGDPYFRVLETRCDFSKSVVVLEQSKDHYFIACQMK